MKEQKKILDEAYEKKRKKHVEKMKSFEEAQETLENARTNQYTKNKERVTKTLIGNIFTFGIYGEVVAEDNKLEEE